MASHGKSKIVVVPPVDDVLIPLHVTRDEYEWIKFALELLIERQDGRKKYNAADRLDRLRKMLAEMRDGALRDAGIDPT